MSGLPRVLWRLSLLILFSITVAGCNEPGAVHKVVPAKEFHRLGCRLCYDEMVRVRTGSPKHRRYKMIERHRCAECMTELAFFADEYGKLRIRCARCAPEGKPCDRCIAPLPPATQQVPRSD